MCTEYDGTIFDDIYEINSMKWILHPHGNIWQTNVIVGIIITIYLLYLCMYLIFSSSTANDFATHIIKKLNKLLEFEDFVAIPHHISVQYGGRQELSFV